MGIIGTSRSLMVVWRKATSKLKYYASITNITECTKRYISHVCGCSSRSSQASHISAFKCVFETMMAVSSGTTSAAIKSFAATR
jgi:hypothetical protein